MSTMLVKQKRPAGKKRPAGPLAKAIAGRPQTAAQSREAWLRQLRSEYTPVVCAQTLALNASLPVAGES